MPNLLLIFLFIILSGISYAQEDTSVEVQKKLQQLVTSYSEKGENVIVIAVPEEDIGELFPEDPKKRQKIESKVLIADKESVYKGKISPGGQSTLKSTTPNLRVKKLKNLTGESETLVGVRNIDRTTRINPLTMDEAYVSTNFYQKALNQFDLLPATGKLQASYAKVIYVPMDKTGALLESKKIHGGLHLVNNHPVKFLANAQSSSHAVEAVGRSRYNIVNLAEKLKIQKPDPDVEILSSAKSPVKTTPYRVEVSWAMDEGKKADLDQLLRKVYAAPINHSGEALYKELAKHMDIDQLYRFLALNHIIRNGDISDEYFWFTQRDKKTGLLKLGIMPQDGDDLLKGAHMFPFNRQQISLIAKDKLGLQAGFIFNFEDPLFRAIKNDPYLYHEYLKTYKSLAKEISSTNLLDDMLRPIENELNAFIHDEEVLKRGSLDEVAKAYDKKSFSNRVNTIKESIRKNAEEALIKIDGGVLSKARKRRMNQRLKGPGYKCSEAMKKLLLGF